MVIFKDLEEDTILMEDEAIIRNQGHFTSNENVVIFFFNAPKLRYLYSKNFYKLPKVDLIGFTAPMLFTITSSCFSRCKLLRTLELTINKCRTILDRFGR